MNQLSRRVLRPALITLGVAYFALWACMPGTGVESLPGARSMPATPGTEVGGATGSRTHWSRTEPRSVNHQFWLARHWQHLYLGGQLYTDVGPNYGMGVVVGGRVPLGDTFAVGGEVQYGAPMSFAMPLTWALNDAWSYQFTPSWIRGPIFVNRFDMALARRITGDDGGVWLRMGVGAMGHLRGRGDRPAYIGAIGLSARTRRKKR